MDLFYPFLYSILIMGVGWVSDFTSLTKHSFVLALMTTINCIVWWVAWFVGDQFMLINECILRIPS